MEKGDIAKVFLLGILVLFFTFLVSASYGFSNYSINSNYSQGSTISGFVNLSFQGEPVSSLFYDNMGNNATLGDLLNYSQGYSYNCTPVNCLPYYAESNPSTSKYFSLGAGQEKTLGFIIKGNLETVNSVSFFVSSDASPSPYNQIKIDFLDDGVIDAGNTKSMDNSIGTPPTNLNFGCYNSSESASETSVGTVPFCQRISLKESPGLLIGGWFKKISDGANSLWANLYNKNAISVGACKILNSSISSSGGYSFCSVNVSVPQNDDYYLCVFSEGGNASYKTLGYTSANPSNNCGFLGDLFQNETASYDIGVSPLNFSTPGTLNISETLPGNVRLSRMVEYYVRSNYPDGCTNGCKIPITIMSSANQNINISNLSVSYNLVSLPGIQTSSLYDFSKKVPTVDSKTQPLYLDGFFKLPTLIGNQLYTLKFNGNTLFSKTISIERFPMVLFPSSYAVGFPIPFLLRAVSNGTVSSVDWNFGDNTTQTTYSLNAVHSYSTTGNYTVTASVYLDGSKFSKSFNVEILPVQGFIDQEISNKESSLASAKSQISLMDAFDGGEVSRVLGINNLTTSLSQIKTSKLYASSDADYQKLFQNLLSLQIPISILQAKSGKVSFIQSSDAVDLSALGSVTGLNYSSESSAYISYWDYQNINSKLSSNRISIQMEDSNIPLNVYDLSLSPKNMINQSYYVIFTNPNALHFEDGSGVKSAGDISYFELGTDSKDIRFSTDLEFSSGLPFFISPKEVSVLPSSVPEANSAKWIWPLGILGVLLIGLIVYLVMNRWYKLKYEKYLFPDRNQLYNAIVYISNSVKNGVEEGEIKKSLTDVGWKGEQVVYLMRKYAGKRTGMFDLFGLFKSREAPKLSTPPKPGKNINYRENVRTPSTKMVSSEIPGFIKFISILMYIEAGVLFVLSILIFFGGSLILFFLGLQNLSSYIILMGLFFILLGGISILVGVGLWKKKNWARFVAAFFYFIGIVLGVILVINGNLSGFFSVVINGFFTFYLIFNKGVREVFL